MASISPKQFVQLEDGSYLNLAHIVNIRFQDDCVYCYLRATTGIEYRVLESSVIDIVERIENLERVKGDSDV